MRGGWHRHLRHFRRLRRALEGGQDPKVFALSCSDSRVSVHEIFDLREPGTIFEAKNVGGLFSDDAKAALVYALNHLNPDFIVVLHHTRCGGYHSLGDDNTESQIRKHMVDYGGFHARVRATAYVEGLRVKLLDEDFEQLVIEEGCRLQAEAIRGFLKLDYPRQYKRVREGGVKVLPLLYDIVSGSVYRVPDALEGSEDMIREEF